MIPSNLDSQVRRLHLRAKRAVEDWLGGAYHSVFKGVGVAFEEVREYQPGDDVRSIDWNVTARTGTPHVKRFIEERELTVMLAVDVGATMSFGSGLMNKRQVATETLALVALAALANNDRVGLLTFAGGRRKLVPPRKGTRHALRLLRHLLQAGDDSDPNDAGDVGIAMRTLQRVLRRRALVFVASDFLGEGFVKPLQLASARHDVIALGVHDPWERALPDVGWLSIRDGDGTRLVDTSSAAVRDEYRNRMQARLDEVRHLVRRASADWVELTAGSHFEALRRFFQLRERRLRH